MIKINAAQRLVSAWDDPAKQADRREMILKISTSLRYKTRELAALPPGKSTRREDLEIQIKNLKTRLKNKQDEMRFGPDKKEDHV